MRFIQYHDRSGALTVGRVVGDSTILPVRMEGGMHALALAAIAAGRPLDEAAAKKGFGAADDYGTIVREGRLLPPLTHADPAHCVITGTGLTHLGSADTRNAMHQKLSDTDDAALSDSLKMFRFGMKGGKPSGAGSGAQPEWFYKGDGRSLAAPEQPLSVPSFSQDAGEEPELVGLYVIGPNGQPYRLGFAIGNELSDHVTEQFNYLWLAHSKLRSCSVGPELLAGSLPKHVEGTSRILREGAVLWEKRFLTGEDNMSHTIANLEHHHFKYPQFRQPGDVHMHFMGTATLSFADGVKTRAGDVFEIAVPEFGRPLKNTLQFIPADDPVRVDPL